MRESNTWGENMKSVSIGGEIGEFKVHDMVGSYWENTCNGERG